MVPRDRTASVIGQSDSDDHAGLLDVLETQAAARPKVKPLPKHPKAGDAVLAAISRSVGTHLAHAPGVVLGEDPEAVHQARVATRRLRSDLRTFAPMLDEGWDNSLREDLRGVAAALGAVRDPEVLALRFEHTALLISDPEAIGPIVHAIAAERAEHRAELLKHMSGSGYLSLLGRLVDASNNPPLSSAAARPAKELAQLLAKPWRRLRKAVRGLPDEPSNAELHRIRILTKRARYAGEAVAPVVGRRAARFAEAAKHLQEVLGALQDAVVAHNWLKEWARGTKDPSAAFTAGELAGLELARQEDSRASWREAWQHLDKKKTTGWIPT